MKRIIPVILSLFVLSLAAASFAATAVVKAEGAAVKSGDDPGVKERALESAMKNSVEAALRLVIKEEKINALSGELLERVFSDPLRYVLNYRILSEGLLRHFDMPEAALKSGEEEQPSGPVDIYHVWIEASVDADGLRRDVGRFTGAGRDLAPVTIEILGVEDWGTFNGLKETIEGMDIVMEVGYRSFSRGKIFITALVAGSGQNLYERLYKELGGAFTVAPAGEDRLIIRKEKPAK
ncbi:MAG: hypothetical protein HY883_00385 [Deltaproteobacteria bacterium]|nr:hypothetical protein [Deltaproteobacteria bacterium]